MFAAFAALKFSRLELEVVGFLIIVAAALMWFGFHDAAVKREAVAPILAKVAAAQEAASAAAAIDAARVTAEQKGNLREAQNQNLARQADARDLAAVVRGLHDDAVRPRTAVEASRAASGSEAGGNPGADMVSGRLFDGAQAAFADTASDAADLAVYIRGLRTSGGLCASDYDSLGQVKP